LAAFAACFGAALAAQQAVAFAFEPLAGAEAVAIGIVWRNAAAGLDPGTAAVLAECRLQHARERVANVAASAHADAELTSIVVVAPAKYAATAAAFVRALLDAPVAFAEDTILVATARAARVADDQLHVVPGGMLTQWAVLHAVGDPATSPYGDPVLMLALTPARVRELLAQPVGAVGVVCGAADAAFAAELPRLYTGAAPSTVPAAPRTVHSPPPEAPGTTVHSRVDQPFVVAAFAVSASPALAVGCELARDRAARRCKLRGSELRAGTPFVAWSWLTGDAVVRFFRRGESFTQLRRGEVAPADAEAERAATAAELEALLADLRARPPSGSELSNARTHLLAESGLAAPTAGAGDAAMIGGRLRNTMLCRERGITAAAVEAVTASEVQQALAAALAPERAHWHALLPVPQADRGWRRR
jgi:hypothetical protein